MTNTAGPRRIGDVAVELGVAAHVLRHWEDVGVLVPPRAPGGQRVYSDDLVVRARLVLLCQRAGLSLAEIKDLFAARSRAERVELFAGKQAELGARVRDLTRTIDFLAHVLRCTHPIVDECPECVGFSREDAAERIGALFG
ncbi:MerR family transcriptional regulator [Nocardia sp. NPDC050413]|uniref:MerR family transcriptional regulator n=1 Tax=Nocardia sp. NPDC050413 TaxID=3155784 RepID=UPI0033E3D0EF